MPDIKQKHRTPIKNINKNIVYAEKIKDNAVNIKNRTNDFINQNEENNPTDNATQNIIDTEKGVTTKVGEKLNEVFSHINSVPRKSLGGKTPYEAFEFPRLSRPFFLFISLFCTQIKKKTISSH